MAMDWLGAGVSLLGGLMGSNSGDKSTTQKQSMDPRMDRYVYGADGQSGLLGNAWNLYQQQAQNGGLNDLMRQGMNMQLQTLQSPQYAAGYEQMRNLGTSLMSGGVAGNPFTGGGTKSAPSTYTPFQYQGIQNASLPTYNTSPQLVSPQTQAALNTLTTGAGGSGGSGSYQPGSTALGSGDIFHAIQNGINTPEGAAAAWIASKLGLLGPMTQTEEAPVTDLSTYHSGSYSPSGWSGLGYNNSNSDTSSSNGTYGSGGFL